eukprot:TRINITY_DN1595_c0_g1_i1.p1 TRINITY_DN1595_c0_g1~~TRINITY_DN1595_c0_g1_i1.p1  ORF type:complete len:1244 (-),score=239.59 TRINITY_DN1595_c0_g1_i1:41-3721(-)
MQSPRSPRTAALHLAHAAALSEAEAPVSRLSPRVLADEFGPLLVRENQHLRLAVEHIDFERRAVVGQRDVLEADHLRTRDELSRLTLERQRAQADALLAADERRHAEAALRRAKEELQLQGHQLEEVWKERDTLQFEKEELERERRQLALDLAAKTEEAQRAIDSAMQLEADRDLLRQQLTKEEESRRLAEEELVRDRQRWERTRVELEEEVERSRRGKAIAENEIEQSWEEKRRAETSLQEMWKEKTQLDRQLDESRQALKELRRQLQELSEAHTQLGETRDALGTQLASAKSENVTLLQDLQTARNCSDELRLDVEALQIVRKEEAADRDKKQAEFARFVELASSCLGVPLDEAFRGSARQESEARSAPTGLVTIVFTDVQSSTELWEIFPVEMEKALHMHNECMRDGLDKHHGYEVKTVGDAFMAAFTAPTDALNWCLEMQTALLKLDWPAPLLQHPAASEEKLPSGETLWRGLRVRMGMHLGEPTAERDPRTLRMDYFGPMVNKAARIGGVSKGGQVVYSEEVRAATTAATAIVKELGLFKLKGIAEPATVFSVAPPVLTGRTFDNDKHEEAQPLMGDDPDLEGKVAKCRRVLAKVHQDASHLGFRDVKSLVEGLETAEEVKRTLTEQNKALEGAIVRLQEEVTHITRERAESERALQETSEALRCAREQCEHLTRAGEEASDRHQAALEAEQKRAADEAEGWNQRLATAITEAAELRTTQQELREALQASATRLDQESEQLRQSRVAKAEVEAELDTVQHTLRSARNENRDLFATNADLHTKLREVQSESSQLRAARADAERQLAARQAEIAARCAEVEREREARLEAERDAAEGRRYRAALQAENRDLKDALEALRQQLEPLVAEVQAGRSECSKLVADLEFSRRELARFQHGQALASSDLGQATQALEKLKAENQMLATALDARTAELRSIGAHRHANGRLEAEADAATNANAGLAAALQASQQELAVLRTTLAETDAKLQEVYRLYRGVLYVNDQLHHLVGNSGGPPTALPDPSRGGPAGVPPPLPSVHQSVLSSKPYVSEFPAGPPPEPGTGRARDELRSPTGGLRTAPRPANDAPLGSPGGPFARRPSRSTDVGSGRNSAFSPPIAALRDSDRGDVPHPHRSALDALYTERDTLPNSPAPSLPVPSRTPPNTEYKLTAPPRVTPNRMRPATTIVRQSPVRKPEEVPPTLQSPIALQVNDLYENVARLLDSITTKPR